LRKSIQKIHDELQHLTEDGITICYNPNEESLLPLKMISSVVKAVALGEERARGDITVILADDELLHQLNLEWLGIDVSTDVLSFDLSNNSEDKLEGDIYISLDRVRSQAQEHSVKPEKELLMLTAHGMLHLCGMDHNDDVSLREMIDRGEKYVQMVF